MLNLADFALQEQLEDNPMVTIPRAWYNGSYTIAAKPIKFLELHYTMIQFLINRGYYTAARRYEFYFQVVKTIFYERGQRVNEILFLTRENKFISSCHRVIFFLLYRQIYRSPFFTDCLHRTAVKEREMTSSISSLVRIWKIRHSGPGCSFV